MSEPLIVHLDPMYSSDSDWEAACGEDLEQDADGVGLIDVISVYTPNSVPADAWNLARSAMSKTLVGNPTLAWCPKCVALIPLVELKKTNYA